jgi:lipoate-protein ligase A
MALDEALLEAAPLTGKPVLRFYGWTERAASFGYFQKFSENARATALRPLVRRPTGGGLVPHDADWTYSLVFPPAHAWYALRATESYKRVHEWIRGALARRGVETELAACGRQEAPGQCFAGYEKSDVLWFGKKIAGAAQRRTKAGLLIQGSVQPPPTGANWTGWQLAMMEFARQEWGVEWVDFRMTPELEEQTRTRQEARYSRADYNERR